MAKVVSIETVGEEDVYDISVDELHNYIANGIVVHNCMLISRELAGFTMAEANRLRRGIGKKKDYIIADLRSQFMKGAKKKIDGGLVTQDEVETVWQKIRAFAKYGFCRSHSVAYSALTCAELWLKYHYPVQFITALLNNTHLGKKKFGHELLQAYINYARKRSFEVLGPDINRSKEPFTIEGESIRFSIGHIKNVANSAETIVAGQPYKDIADFYERAAVETVTAKGKPTKKRINKRVVESLIFAGAFDCFGKREEVIKQYYECRKDKKAVVFQGTEKQWREHEEETIGVCLSVKPLRWRYAKEIKENRWCVISEVEGKGRTKVFGRIASIIAKTSKKGNQMYIVDLTDDLDSMKFFVFGGGMTKFTNDFKTGYVGVIPLKKFEDSETRFYDVDREGEIIEK
jgi:DNA polymerase III alpha subunit